ncbi:hypothetical protein MM26B8_05500 [Mycoplasmopsis meleagridis]|uniref:Uncharacterized protein n=1 Tax=Mycoplasmopsis meleagridis ATCC 25294 TaxID=1264554 RepID=A0A0F5H035_9BACT|nr:hypothetical protein [Mycoplasmopsis meleagridis]KKB26644.1 hypothetical protein MMELEA_00250 [Mycoplasmopsis meleagridis ATCC 25294]KUH47652.1 hypothetical protein ASB56_00770 [Mycoplasmopsis meleagridis]OAD18241.1 hypothetical protein MM26B8_05500 [Mycoplasmopsis meleagridis]VEU77698.1 Uncharacterised protein [Mycoplasmopsis meleagridis]
MIKDNQYDEQKQNTSDNKLSVVEKDNFIATSIVDANKLHIYHIDELNNLPEEHLNALYLATINDVNSDLSHIKKSKRKMLISNIVLWSIVVSLLVIIVFLLLGIFLWNKANFI